MPVVKSNGINMAYEERGSGDPLVCIMGVTAPGAVWDDFNPRTTEWLLKH